MFIISVSERLRRMVMTLTNERQIYCLGLRHRAGGCKYQCNCISKFSCVHTTGATVDNGGHLFDELCRPNTNISSWNEKIRGYNRIGQYEESIRLYSEMHIQFSGVIIPSRVTFVFVLKACAGLGALQEGMQIHSHIVRYGFHSDVFVATALLDMYAKGGIVGIARQVFDRMPQREKERDVIPWNAMIAAYVANRAMDEVWRLVGLMQTAQVHFNSVTLITLLSAFVRAGACALEQSKVIHCYALKNEFHTHLSVSNALIDVYAKLGCIEISRRVFDKVSQSERDVVSWTSMIAGCVQNGQPKEALTLFYQMQKTEVCPNYVTLLSLLSACADLGDLQEGKRVHSYITKRGLKLDDSLGSALVAMYTKCGSTELAQRAFDTLSKRDAVSWNAMIAGYAQNGCFDKALVLFHEMRLQGIEPDGVTMVSVLPACAQFRALSQGMRIHSYSVTRGIIAHISVCNALIDMYAKCGNMKDASHLFDKMSKRDLVSWNSLMAGYAQNGESNEAMAIFHKLLCAGMTPNLITVVSVLSVCGDLKALQQGKDIHDYIKKNGFDSNISVMTALVAMYSKCGEIETACHLFDKMSKRDVVAWNAMIAGYVQNGQATEALTLFYQLQLADVKPDSATVATVLSACAHLGALQHGMWIHAYIIRSGFELDVQVGTAVIDMYAKCGSAEFSYQFFQKMCNKDVTSWNAMIAAYGMNGHCENALALFAQMQQAGPMPDGITFVCVLSACSHSGLVNEGWQYFDCMSRDFCITPRMEHYACMVDLLGRVGLLDEAHKFIINMPLEPGINVWGALLFACKIYCNAELGEHVANILLELDSMNSGSYILLSSIYAMAKRWNDAEKMRTMIKESGLEKIPGCSWIEIKNRVYLFFAGDKSHKQSEVYGML